MYEFDEHHAIAVAADAAAIEQALRAVTLADVPIARGLWFLRVLPARLRRKRRRPEGGTLVDQLLALGGVMLEDRPGLLVVGLAGRFWRPSGDYERFHSPDQFRSYQPGGSSKAVLEFVWGDGRLETTTRVHVPDPAAARSFRRYWLVVRPFSGVIRVALLRAVKRRAEAHAAH